MSVVKIMFVKHAKNLLRYVTDGRDGNDPVEAYNCSPNTASEDFDVIANLHHGLGDISAIHIVQSWNEDESKKVMPEEFNVMGKQMVETKFPGHAYLVVTHTNTGRTHNHIIVSPWHSESGKKIENKKRHLYELRSINDTICKERGLSVINGKAKDRAARMPDKAQRVMRFNSRSWLADLSQKADLDAHMQHLMTNMWAFCQSLASKPGSKKKTSPISIPEKIGASAEINWAGSMTNTNSKNSSAPTI